MNEGLRLEPVIGKETFYVIRWGKKIGICDYVGYPQRGGPGFRGVDTVEEARHFPTILSAVEAVIARNRAYAGLGAQHFEFVRVEKTITPGVEQRTILDHGDPAPEGATIKWAVANEYQPGMLLCDLESAPYSYGVCVDGAPLYYTELDAVNAVKIHNVAYDFRTACAYRRIAITRAEPTVEYTETVIA